MSRVRQRYAYLSYEDQLTVYRSIQECIESELPYHPIPDQEIGRRIQEQHGITLNKCHVEYYRKKLGLPSYIKRKRNGSCEPVEVGSVRKPRKMSAPVRIWGRSAGLNVG